MPLAARKRFTASALSSVSSRSSSRKAPGAEPDYKPGVAALYRDLGLPCTPMATNSGVHWPANGMPSKPGVVVFEFLEPIPAGLKRGAFMQELQTRIEAASNALIAEGL